MTSFPIYSYPGGTEKQLITLLVTAGGESHLQWRGRLSTPTQLIGLSDTLIASVYQVTKEATGPLAGRTVAVHYTFDPKAHVSPETSERDVEGHAALAALSLVEYATVNIDIQAFIPGQPISDEAYDDPVTLDVTLGESWQKTFAALFDLYVPASYPFKLETIKVALSFVPIGADLPMVDLDHLAAEIHAHRREAMTQLEPVQPDNGE